MLKSIKERLLQAEAERQAKITSNDDIENAAIMECAKIFNELDDLSIDGTDLNQRRNIDVLDIKFDDIELESVEISINDGRILDIPADILVHSESYAGMKSFEDFYTEAYENTDRNYMEPESLHNDKVRSIAVQEYRTYLGQIFQEGLFSAGKVSLSDSSIQWFRTIDFGPSDPNDPKSAPYILRLGIAYVSKDGKHILVKQRDTVSVMIDPFPETFKNFGAKYVSILEEKGYSIPSGKNVWDVVIPKRIIVPEQPIDQFIFFIEAENVMSKSKDDDMLYLGYSAPISGMKKKGVMQNGISDLDSKQIKLFTDTNSLSRTFNQKDVIKESMAPKSIIGRVVQEAIDFSGTGDGENPPADNNADAAPSGGGDSTPSINAGGGDAVSTTDDTGSTNDTQGAQVTTNDVSDKIAGKVSEEVNKQKDAENAEGNESLNAEVTDTPEVSDESIDADLESIEGDGDTASSDDADIDQQLNDLDVEGETNDALGDEGGTTNDIGNVADMSPNDLEKHAVDKIKNMSIAQIQAFLNDDTTSTGEGEVTTEAFILTRKNINAELDASLRKSLGDLNDSKKNIDELVSSFKNDGRKLNRALSKASKMTDLYAEGERKAFIKFNKCLADLLVAMKPNANKSEVQLIKRLIKAFVQQAAGVGKIIDKHKSEQTPSSSNGGKKKTIDREVE